MVITTFIARVADGLILCESWDSGSGDGGTQAQDQKNKVNNFINVINIFCIETNKNTFLISNC